MNKKFLPEEATKIGVYAIAVARNIVAATTLSEFVALKAGDNLQKLLRALGEYTIVADELVEELNTSDSVAARISQQYDAAAREAAAAKKDRAEAATCLKRAREYAAHAKNISEAADAAIKFFSTDLKTK